MNDTFVQSISGLYLFLAVQYIVRILALFQGRVIDDNRSDMLLPGTKYSTGGEVEHKVRFQLLKCFYE